MTLNPTLATKAVLALTVILILTPGIDGQTFQIDGQVFNSKGDPVDGAEVTVWQGGKPTGEHDTSKADGSYKVKITKGQLVTRVQYTHIGYDPGEEVHLSDKRGHSISKVLYVRGEPRSLAATLEALSAFRNSVLFALTDADAGPAQRTLIRTLFFTERLAALPVDQSLPPGVSAYLNSDKNQLLQLYRSLPQ